MYQNAPILRLPQELLVRIITYLPRMPSAIEAFVDAFKAISTPSLVKVTSAPDISPLLQLRATCKELNQRLVQMVGVHYFSYRQCNVVDEKDLETLLCISRHPTFSKTLHNVTLACSKMYDILAMIEHHGEAIARAFDLRNYDQEVGCRYRVSRERYASRHPELLQSCKRVLESQSRFIRRGGGSGYIHLILSNLKAANSTPMLQAGMQAETVGSLALPREMRHDMERSQRVFDDCGFRYGLHPHDYHPLEILSESIRNTQYPVTALKLGSSVVGSPGIPLSPREFVFAGPTFANLKRLLITLSSNPRHISDALDGLEKARISMPPFIAFLRQCRNLEELGLEIAYFSGASGPGIFAAIANEVSANSADTRALQNLSLFSLGENFYYTSEDLFAFVRSTRSTLNVLGLGNAPEGEREVRGSRLEIEVLKAYGGKDLKLEGSAFIEDVDDDSEEDYSEEYASEGDASEGDASEENDSEENGSEENGSGENGSGENKSEKDNIASI